MGSRAAGKDGLAKELIEFPQDTAQRVVHQVAARKLPSFASFPHIGIDDLKQEGLAAVQKAWPRYDGRVQASTFIYSVAQLHLRFLHRTASRAKAREIRRAVDNPAPVSSMPPPTCDELGDLPDWLESLMRMMKRSYCRDGVDNDVVLPAADSRYEPIRRIQGAALLALRAKVRIGDIGDYSTFLREHPELLDVIGLSHPVGVPRLLKLQHEFRHFDYRRASRGE
jgi:hypothetical protein